MNKREAIELLQKMAQESFEFAKIHAVHIDSIVEVINQIHEPQKVRVPTLIDSYIRYAKAEGMSLFIAMDNAQNKESGWIIDNEETFARAWFDGYEIEQEQLYTVEIPNPVLTDNSDSVTVLMKIDSGVVLTDVVNYIGRKQETVYHLTESEIKQDFEWAWQWAKEVE